MSYNAKTDWVLDEVVLPSDMNRIEQGIENVDNRIYESTENITTLKLIDTTNVLDNTVILVKNLGFFRFDKLSVETGNDDTVITPNTGGGRWKYVNVMSDGVTSITTAIEQIANDRGYIITKQLEANSDFNDVPKANGIYMVFTELNAPIKIARWYFVEVKVHNELYVEQKATPFADTEGVYKTYRRNLFSGQWLEWREIPTVNNISNPNLIINPDFQVWQRGTSFPLSEPYTYTADRWRAQKGVTASGNVTKHYNSLRIETTSEALILHQYVEGNFLGKTLTLSIKVNGEIMTCTGEVQTAVPVVTKLSDDGIVSAYFIEENGFLVAGVNIYVGVAVIDWIKLELGEIATPLSPKPYGEELALCQRYCFGESFIALPYIVEASNIWFFIPLSTSLRVYPTLSKIGDLSVKANNGVTQTGFTFSNTKVTGNGIYILATKVNHGLTLSNNPYLYSSTAIFDAEIY